MRGASPWIAAGEPVVVAGRRITAGMLYVGHTLRSASGAVEPAQINPHLPVDPAGTRPTTEPGPCPGYHVMSAAHRAAYLDWLSDGRRRADLPIGLVTLFCSGLERRILLDHTGDPRSTRHEPAQFAAELERLVDLFGPAHPSFRRYASTFLDVLEVLAAPPRRAPGDTWPPAPAVPGDTSGRGPGAVPLLLRIVLAQCANAGEPVPANWVRAWAWYHPVLFPSTPQTRCPEEFTRLFLLRLQAGRPGGLVPSAVDAPAIRLGYRPANPGMDTVVVERPDLPDVVQDPHSTRLLGALTDEVTAALTPYSRWLARTPQGRDTLASTRLLPADLLAAAPGPLGPLLDWTERRLAGRGHAVVDTAEFAAHWSSADRSGRMSRDEACAFADVLERIGVGVEPDARFGGPPLRPGPAVLFRLAPTTGDPLQRPRLDTAVSPRFTTAGQLLAVAAATVLSPETVLSAGGDAVNRAITTLTVDVDLTVRERTRLAARLHWLLAVRPDPRTVRRATARLSASDRSRGGDFLIRLATEGGTIGHSEVTALAEAFRYLGLPLDDLHRRAHAALAEPPSGRPAGADPVSGPVVVRGRRPTTTGHALPWAGSPADVRLREEVVARRIEETAAVGALLAEIFTDDAGDAPGPVQTHPQPEDGPPGPDDAHLALLADIVAADAAGETWTTARFDAAAARRAMLPAAALDILNDVAISIVGEPVLDVDGDLLRIDTEIAAELLP